MKLSTQSFRGMAPRLTPRALPENGSQQAINARLLTGDLQPWKRPLLTESLSNAGLVRSIFLLDDIWLSYEQEVEFARGTILGDTTFRTYITGLDAPRFTNKSLAEASGSPPYPADTRLLGVPAPSTDPVVVVTVAPPDESNLTLVNPGAEAGNTSGWTIDSGGLIAIENGDIPDLDAQAGDFFFGGGSAAATEAYQSVDIETLGVIAGQGLTLTWWQATGGAGSTAGMAMEFYDDSAALLSTVESDQLAPVAYFAWEQRTLSTQVPDGAVTMRVVQQYVRVGVGPELDAYIDTISLNAIAYTNSFDGSSLAGWNVSPNSGNNDSDKHRMVLIDDTFGWPAPSIKMRCDEMVPWFHRDFSTNRTPQVIAQFDYLEQPGRTNAGLHCLLYAGDNGFGSSIFFSAWGGLRVYTHAEWDQIGASVETLVGALPANVRYTVTLVGEQLSSSSARVTIGIINAATSEVIVSGATTVIPIDGDRIGFKMSPGSLHDIVWLDNISVTVAAPDADDDGADPIYTSYVYTFVNEFGEESAPSDPSDTVQRNENAVTTITTPTFVPSGISEDYGIVYKRIYRSVTGTLGSEFLFVAEIPLAQADYVDTLTDAELGEPLESTDWDLPPSDLRYILALPNGIMVGAAGNQLCLSVRNRPHAWPVAYRLPTDTVITGLGNVDTSVVIGTKSFVYTASGNEPASYSMSKPGAPHACSSARSFAYLLRIGAVFAGPDGLMAVNGPTDVINLTETIFTREQWQALGPDTMVGLAHDDIYFLFYGDPETADTKGGFALDMKPNGFGLIELGLHASAVAADMEHDALVLCLDQYEEPSSEFLPVESGSEPFVDGRHLYEWDGGVDDMRYAWTGKLWLNEYPKAWAWVRVLAEDYEALEIEFSTPAGVLMTKLVTSDVAFRLPVRSAYNSISWRVLGSSRVRTVELADDVNELA